MPISKNLSVAWFVVILAFANALLYHYPLANFAMENLDYRSLNGVRTLITLFVIVFTSTTIILFAISLLSPLLLKAFAMIAAIGNAIAFYYVLTYNVILDKSMMGNILNTQMSESTELIHPNIFIYIVVMGLLPAWLIFKTRVGHVKRLRTLLYIILTLGLCLVTIYINASTSLWFDKYSKKLGGMIMPWSYSINSARLYFEQSKSNKEFVLLPQATSNTNEKTVVVLVIGETARANNFSLYGYTRQTNPLMSEADIVVLPNATACSTYTIASVHCMLSYTGAQKGHFEPLPSYLHRNGVEVWWRTNNFGEPILVVDEYIKSGELKQSCTLDNCEHDEVLLSGLQEKIQSSSADKLFVVLHTKGSHGPSYHSRYPKQFEVFKPVCRSVEISKCSEEELINAYDNTIIYTDYFLDQTLSLLKNLEGTSVAMLYASDHGESLGEYGLYLHGTPNALAPAVQLEIPFFVWMSDRFKQIHRIDADGFNLPEYSHKHVFHSIMGAFDMQSDVYDSTLDIFNQQ